MFKFSPAFVILFLFLYFSPVLSFPFFILLHSSPFLFKIILLQSSSFHFYLIFLHSFSFYVFLMFIYSFSLYFFRIFLHSFCFYFYFMFIYSFSLYFFVFSSIPSFSIFILCLFIPFLYISFVFSSIPSFSIFISCLFILFLLYFFRIFLHSFFFKFLSYVYLFFLFLFSSYFSRLYLSLSTRRPTAWARDRPMDRAWVGSADLVICRFTHAAVCTAWDKQHALLHASTVVQTEIGRKLFAGVCFVGTPRVSKFCPFSQRTTTCKTFLPLFSRDTYVNCSVTWPLG